MTDQRAVEALLQAYGKAEREFGVAALPGSSVSGPGLYRLSAAVHEARAAVLAAFACAAKDGWQPMETAPKDGAEIVILWRAYEDDKLKAQNVCWQEDGGYTDENGERHTHPAGFYGTQGGLFVYGKCWMPLPAIDAARGSAEKSNQPRYKTVADWSP